MSMFSSDAALARAKKKAQAAIARAVALIDKEASPAVRQQAMRDLSDALYAGQRLEDWKDRRSVIDAAAAYIEAASMSEAEADDTPF